MHVQFIRQTVELSNKKSWQWLQRGELKNETKVMLMRTQDQTLRTKHTEAIWVKAAYQLKKKKVKHLR